MPCTEPQVKVSLDPRTSIFTSIDSFITACIDDKLDLCEAEAILTQLAGYRSSLLNEFRMNNSSKLDCIIKYIGQGTYIQPYKLGEVFKYLEYLNKLNELENKLRKYTLSLG
jgi:hypothetical protein